MRGQNFLIPILFISASAPMAKDFINIRTNPVMVLGAEFVNLELDFRVSDRWSIGTVTQSQTSEPAYKVGIRVTRYEKGVFQPGWMTGMEALFQVKDPGDADYYYDSGSYCTWDENIGSDVCGYDSRSLVSIVLDHDYFWRWKTFNVGLGVGAELATEFENPENVALLSAVHFSIGWIR